MVILVASLSRMPKIGLKKYVKVSKERNEIRKFTTNEVMKNGDRLWMME